MPDHFNVTDDVPETERTLNLFESLLLIAMGGCFGFIAAYLIRGVAAC
ncbi:MAG: hypothetical protein KBC94_07745 [Pseudacidovorax sp.]|nr:hypothetical protein [Pseudacidovorax sp.]MBP6894300.1 hypothetical protein [Pseudacidovorax sp.]